LAEVVLVVEVSEDLGLVEIVLGMEVLLGEVEVEEAEVVVGAVVVAGAAVVDEGVNNGNEN
jgi:uncharacterized membrane protein YkgB